MNKIKDSEIKNLSTGKKDFKALLIKAYEPKPDFKP